MIRIARVIWIRRKLLPRRKSDVSRADKSGSNCINKVPILFYFIIFFLGGMKHPSWDYKKLISFSSLTNFSCKLQLILAATDRKKHPSGYYKKSISFSPLTNFSRKLQLVLAATDKN